MSHDDHKRMKIFSATGGAHLAEAMCKHLELPIAAATVERFPDGEIIVKIDEDVRGRDCFIVQSTSMPVNETLMELLIWIDTLRRASAGPHSDSRPVPPPAGDEQRARSAPLPRPGAPR